MPKKAIENSLNTVLDFIGVSPNVEIVQEETVYKVYITGDDLNFLIGYKGESLDALQHIITQAVYKKTSNWHPVFIDINEYKESKLRKLDDMVKNVIDRVRFHQKEIRLPKLTSYERRYVHTFVSDYVDVESESRGEGRERYLYIKPLK